MNDSEKSSHRSPTGVMTRVIQGHEVSPGIMWGYEVNPGVIRGHDIMGLARS